jgi:hypothetical protein
MFDRRHGVLALALLVLGCQAKPAGRDAYSGEPVRAAIHSSCTAELIDERGHACVQVDVFAEGEGAPATRGEWLTLHYIVEVDGNTLDGSHDGKPSGGASWSRPSSAIAAKSSQVCRPTPT